MPGNNKKGIAMLRISIDDEWVQTVQLFGDVESVVKKALRAYFIQQCQQRIREVAIKIAVYTQKYDCDYETFKHAIQTDQDFLTRIEAENPLWEEDAMEWEYWLEELQTWKHRLKAILQR